MRLLPVSGVLLLVLAGTTVPARGADVPAVSGEGPGIAISPPPAPVDFAAEGRRLYLAGDLEGAALAWERASAADPRAIAPHLALGLVRLRLGRGPASVASFLAAQRLAPADPLVAYHLGLAYALAGDREAARAAYARTLALDPGHAGARANLAALGPESGASPPIPGASAVPPVQRPAEAPQRPAGSATMALRRAEARLARNDQAGALAALREGVAAQPDDPALWRALGRLFARQRDLAAAEAVTRKALALAPADPAGPLALAAVLGEGGRFADAEAQLARAARLGARPADLAAARAALARQRRSLP